MSPSTGRSRGTILLISLDRMYDYIIMICIVKNIDRRHVYELAFIYCRLVASPEVLHKK